jgi:hypothetical protein
MFSIFYSGRTVVSAMEVSRKEQHVFEVVQTVQNYDTIFNTKPLAIIITIGGIVA